MKLKPHKRAPMDIDRGTKDRNTSQSPSEHELVPNQITSVSATTPSAGTRGVPDQEWAELSAGDPDVSRQGIDTGEETPGGSTPTPDQDMVDEIGKAVGVTYQDDEPLIFDEKYAKRDDARWEDDPASSEDYIERQAILGSDSSLKN